MDIIVKTMLDFVQGQKGYENSVLAGGAVRDYFLGIEPKDYDIVVPYTSFDGRTKLLMNIMKEFDIGEKKEKGVEYADSRQQIRGVDGFEFEGKKFDIIVRQLDDDEDFGKRVVETFDYGYNMAYYDGLVIHDDNEKFRYDRDNWTYSLHNLEKISNLPKAIQRYNDLNKRLEDVGRGGLHFRATCLEIKGEKEEKYTIKWKTSTAGNFVNPVPRPADLRAQEREALQDVIGDLVREERAIQARRGARIQFDQALGDQIINDPRPVGEPIRFRVDDAPAFAPEQEEPGWAAF